MNKTEYQSNGQPVAVDFEDLKEKLGYKTYKPRIGNIGRALIKLCRNELYSSHSRTKEGNHRSIGWLKHQLDELYRKDKQKMNKKKDRKHHNGKNKN